MSSKENIRIKLKLYQEHPVLEKLLDITYWDKTGVKTMKIPIGYLPQTNYPVFSRKDNFADFFKWLEIEDW